LVAEALIGGGAYWLT